jgi:hypothetical protein
MSKTKMRIQNLVKKNLGFGFYTEETPKKILK